MKKLKEVASMTIELFHNYVKNQADKYWRYYIMWYNHCDLAESDPDKFIKQESESGSAMWDDPPEDWNERDLYIWSKGYARGREVECGNVHGIMKQLESLSAKLLNTDYGFRDGMPSIEEVEIHGYFVGFWMFLYKNPDKNHFIPHYPMLYILQVKNNKIQHWSSENEKWEKIPEKDIQDLIKTMPVTVDGIPVSWKNLKKKKQK